jgi:hypothetical protein
MCSVLCYNLPKLNEIFRADPNSFGGKKNTMLHARENWQAHEA